MNQPLAVIETKPAELYRQSTDIAAICKEIVLKSSMEIQERKYVRVEGWQSIATAHGCAASARDVKRVDGGFSAIGEVRRMSDGIVIAEAEGFVGEDEPTWFGGQVEKDEWTGPKGNRRKTGEKIIVTMPKRPDYAIRAMCQTRAISRACRTAFAHVVVMMDAGLSTTPAEEVPHGGFDNEPDPVETHSRQREEASDAASTVGNWRTVEIHFGKKKGVPLSKLDHSSVVWYRDNAQKSVDAGKASKDDRRLLAALTMALLELNPPAGTKSAHEAPKAQDGPHQELKNLVNWEKPSEERFIEVCHEKGWLHSDVCDIDRMTEDEVNTALAKFTKEIKPLL